MILKTETITNMERAGACSKMLENKRKAIMLLALDSINIYALEKELLFKFSKYAEQIKKSHRANDEKITSGKPKDMGRLSDFSDAEITFLISILISKYGTDRVVNNISEIWEDLRAMAEQGIKILYTKIYKEKSINTEIFNTILNLDEELKI